MIKNLFIAVFFIIAAYAAFLFLQVRSIEIETLSDDLHVIRGIGSNTTVLKTSAGTVVIDSMTFPMQGEIIRKKAQELTGQKVVLLINTHYHLDHTHGNPGFDAGTRVVSTERTLAHLKALDADFWKDDAAKYLPSETFTDQLDITIGNKTLHLLNPGRGHTDGDLVVFIKEESAIAMGDLLFHEHYPNIDLEAGGSVQYWPNTLANVLKLNFNTVIPGHGATTDKSGIMEFQKLMIQLSAIGLNAEAQGTDLETTLNTRALTADENYTPLRFAGISIGLDREFVIRRAWEEATGNFKLKNE